VIIIIIGRIRRTNQQNRSIGMARLFIYNNSPRSINDELCGISMIAPLRESAEETIFTNSHLAESNTEQTPCLKQDQVCIKTQDRIILCAQPDVCTPSSRSMNSSTESRKIQGNFLSLQNQSHERTSWPYGPARRSNFNLSSRTEKSHKDQGETEYCHS
jgi:hypothetical protein